MVLLPEPLVVPVVGIDGRKSPLGRCSGHFRNAKDQEFVPLPASACDERNDFDPVMMSPDPRRSPQAFNGRIVFGTGLATEA